MENYYTIAEVAEKLKCSVVTIRRRVKSGSLKTVKNGKLYLIPESALESYLHTTETPVNDNLVTATDAPLQPTASPTTGDKATLETDAQQPDDTTGEPSSVPEWDGISGKPIAPLPDS